MLSFTQLAFRPLVQVGNTQVFRLLNDAVQGIDVDLPDATSILPFLNLFTLVILLPNELKESSSEIPAYNLPGLFVLNGNKFVAAPADTLPDAPGVARIFDVLAISDDLSKSSCVIPLSSEYAEFTHQRYWRVPVKPEVLLMMLMNRAIHTPECDCEEVKDARIIYCILFLNQTGVHEIRLSAGKKRTSEDRDDDEPPHKHPRGDPTAGKRTSRRMVKAAKTINNPRPGPRPKKTRPVKI